jgi:uncharacterized protein YbgA (DUF1722 family)/uncharacterized protein YbbK (DUF523 family)
MIASETVKRLQAHAEMYAVCPEMEIGLGIPREPLRLVEKRDKVHLTQPSTGHDVTEEMHTFTERFLKSLPALDGIILKDRSPSCGLKNVSIYTELEAPIPNRRERGLFAHEIVTCFPQLPNTTEKDLASTRLRDHFLSQIYAVAEFRAVRNHETTKNLLQFHAENKYLLNAYHRTEFKTLTDLATNRKERSFDVVVREYEEHLLLALSRPPRVTSHLAVLRHALTHFADAAIPGRDREKLEELMKAYHRGEKPLSAPRTMIHEWIVAYDEDYLSQQTYFEPYPTALQIPDPGRLII